MRAISDKELVRLCLEELCNKMGYTDRSKILQSDLEHLCYLIEENTRIVISISTLKRIFSEKFERLPQIATLDALTTFLGYSGWQDFKTRKINSVSEEKAVSTEHRVAEKKPTTSGNLVRVSSAIILIAILFSLFFVATRKNTSSKAVFSVQKIVSQDVPANVIFNYDIDNIEGDSFYIQPSWNKKMRIKIEKNNHTQTETYYEPGYHTAKLICDNKVLKQVQVHITTKGWVGYSKVNFSDPYPQYFQNETIVRDSVLGLNLRGLQASGIEIKDEKIYYYACFPDSLEVNSDNFTMTARVRMDPVKPTLCPWIISEVYSQNSLFFFTGTIPGCTGEVKALFSDKYLDGKKNDLSSLGFDVRNWKNVRIEVKKKEVRISVEGKEVFATTYKRPGGLIQGMGFGSNGLCEVDYVQLTDSVGNIVYRNDFKN
ncbi:MAG TPA: hypothetical protein VGQ59_01535 [Cyclobacteriaceae bacterium]|jgi:hypothetical protein|nr:hypothetical protein [Cyclobacteriaceae bacterium]